MKITYYGHSCFLVEAAGKRIFFDPFVTGNTLRLLNIGETVGK